MISNRRSTVLNGLVWLGASHFAAKQHAGTRIAVLLGLGPLQSDVCTLLLHAGIHCLVHWHGSYIKLCKGSDNPWPRQSCMPFEVHLHGLKARRQGAMETTSHPQSLAHAMLHSFCHIVAAQRAGDANTCTSCLRPCPGSNSAYPASVFTEGQLELRRNLSARLHNQHDASADSSCSSPQAKPTAID